MNNLKNIEANIGYNFLNNNLLYSALTHPSLRKKNNVEYLNFEYLEFLGDRVIGLCITQMLEKSECIKEIAMKHATLVSTKIMAKIAKQWEIEKYLQHEIQNLSQKVLADTIEALIGAMFLDSNLSSVQKIITKFWMQFLDTCKIDPKMQLQEFAQKHGNLPNYQTIKVTETDNNKKSYTINVKIIVNEAPIEKEGTGESKHEASKNAAHNLLKEIGLID